MHDHPWRDSAFIPTWRPSRALTTDLDEPSKPMPLRDAKDIAATAHSLSEYTSHEDKSLTEQLHPHVGRGRIGPVCDIASMDFFLSIIKPLPH